MPSIFGIIQSETITSGKMLLREGECFFAVDGRKHCVPLSGQSLLQVQTNEFVIVRH